MSKRRNSPPRPPLPSTTSPHPPTTLNPLQADWNAALAKQASRTPSTQDSLDTEALLGTIDFGQMNEVFQNFLEVVGLPVAIIDLKARVLASSNWQRACMQFHRVHPVTLQRCIESNTQLFRQIEESEKLSVCRCSNGLTDCAAPIVIEGRHVANLFVGQFFTSEPDMAFFRAQQQAMGFDESSYLEAIAEIPVIAKDRLPAILQLLTRFAGLIATRSVAEYRARRAREEIDQLVSERTEELQEAQRIARLGYWRLDLKSNRLIWSDEIFRIFELDPHQFEPGYEAFLKIIHPDDREAVNRAFTESVASRSPYAISHRLLMPDGRVKYVREQGRTDYAEDGSPLRTLGTVQDITAQEEIRSTLASKEAALVESEARYRELIQGIHVAIVVHGPDTAILDYNPQALELLDLTDEQMRGRSAFSPDWRFLDSDGNRLATSDYPVNRVIADNAPLRNEVCGIVRLNRGDTVWALVNADPVRDPEGRIKQIRVSFIDISDRKQAEDELAGYRQQLENLVRARTADLESAHEHLRDTQYAMDHVGIATHWADASTGRFLYVNDHACRMLDYTREELLAMGVQDIDPNFASGTFEERTQPLREQGYARFETLNRHRDGHLIPVEVTLYFDPASADRKARFITFITDISQRKQAEAELMQAKDAAEAANRSKSVFLANMSHELRTPLNAILGFAQLMARDADISEVHRGELETINRSGRHLLSLINDVLEISRIEAGRTSVQNEAFDLDATLTAVGEMIRVRADSKGLALAVERHGELPTYVMGDAHHLRQVLINLLGNAVKYTDRGKIGLHLYPEGESIRFEISDTGSGIAAKDQERIFHPFYQTEAGIAKGEGTGLGLTISREFVRLMGGTLSVRSEPGKGSTFSFTLPLPPAPSPAGIAQRGQVVGLKPGQPSYRILVAEDHPDNRELITRLLESIGFVIRTVENGLQAIEAFETWHPHLIWMDMRMPVMDGYEAARRIRALPDGKHIPIVALTASAFEENRAEVLAAGCNDMLKKPIDEQHLFEIMQHYLGVEFEYTGTGPAEETRRASGSAPDLGILPQEWRNSLQEAAALLDLEQCQSLIEEIETTHPEQARQLGHLLSEYRFDLIGDACQSR